MDMLAGSLCQPGVNVGVYGSYNWAVASLEDAWIETAVDFIT